MQALSSQLQAPVAALDAASPRHVAPLKPHEFTMSPTRPADHLPLIATTRRDMMQDSQESYVSAASGGFAGPRLLSSSSNISNSTGPDTELTSPTSSNEPSSQSQGFDSSQSVTASPPRQRPQQYSRPIAPPLNTDLRESSGSGSATATSPMSIDTPALAPASKRTASGTLKQAGCSTMESPMRAPARGGHSRNTSTDSNVSRIGELSAQLKTRLSYALVKVQNGWEKHTIEELEELPSQMASPIEVSGRRSLDSPRFANRRRRPSGVSEASDQYMASPSQASPTGISRSLNGTPPSAWQPGSSSQPLPQRSLMYTGANNSNGPALAPAADIVSRRNRRSNSTHIPPMLDAQRKYYSDVGAPSTPTSIPRAGILRMPSQAAEREAVNTLLFMSSPNNSNRLAHTSADGQPSPLRTEFPVAKRVVFENRHGSSSEPDDLRIVANGSRDAVQKTRLKALDYAQGPRPGESYDEMPLQPFNKR